MLADAGFAAPAALFGEGGVGAGDLCGAGLPVFASQLIPVGGAVVLEGMLSARRCCIQIR